MFSELSLLRGVLVVFVLVVTATSHGLVWALEVPSPYFCITDTPTGCANSTVCAIPLITSYVRKKKK